MNQYVEIDFRNRKTEYYLQDNNIELTPDGYVIVEVERGIDIGQIVQFGIESPALDEQLQDIAKYKILRMATENDMIALQNIEENERDATEKFLECKKNYDFEMKLLETIYQFDGNKLTFFFAADGRIDFREFVRELAKIFHTRIELHQTSGRDEAKRLGGIGMCGRGYCCSTFIKRFNQVTIKMVKDQNLSGNLSKISGPCGRLLCCLHYEENYYVKQSEGFPEVGDEIFINNNKMYVYRNDYYNNQIHLTNDSEEIKSITLEEYNALKNHKCKGCGDHNHRNKKYDSNLSNEKKYGNKLSDNGSYKKNQSSKDYNSSQRKNYDRSNNSQNNSYKRDKNNHFKKNQKTN